MSVVILILLLGTASVTFCRSGKMFFKSCLFFYTNITILTRRYFIPLFPLTFLELLSSSLSLSLSEVCETFLTKVIMSIAFNHLPAYDRTKLEGYSLMSVNGEKPKTAAGLNPDFRVISKWFIRNSFLVVVAMILSTLLRVCFFIPSSLVVRTISITLCLSLCFHVCACDKCRYI